MPALLSTRVVPPRTLHELEPACPLDKGWTPLQSFTTWSLAVFQKLLELPVSKALRNASSLRTRLLPLCRDRGFGGLGFRVRSQYQRGSERSRKNEGLAKGTKSQFGGLEGNLKKAKIWRNDPKAQFGVQKRQKNTQIPKLGKRVRQRPKPPNRGPGQKVWKRPNPSLRPWKKATNPIWVRPGRPDSLRV